MEMIFFFFLALLIVETDSFVYRDEIIVQVKERNEERRTSEAESEKIDPLGALVPCQYLPSEYYHCESIEDVHENDSRSCQKKNGRRFGGERSSEVGYGSIICEIYSGIECSGNRTLIREHVPCLKYSSHHFLSTLFYSIFLGLFAVDRYSLGHIGIAVGKMITLGGLGLWWIIDIILLIFGKLMPADDSNWISGH